MVLSSRPMIKLIQTSATIASICRLHALYILRNSKDVTWDSPATATWSAMELNTGIICASLPTLRAFFTKYWPRAFLTSWRGSHRTGADEGTAKGQYYNMEGSVMVKKTITINRVGDDVQLGTHIPQTIDQDSSHGVGLKRQGTADSEQELTALPQ